MGTCAVLVALISLIDYYSGADLTFSLFYFAVIVLLSWKVAIPRYAVVGAIAIACVWLVADWLTLGAPHEGILLWNATMRLVVLVGLAVIVCRLREALASEQSAARTDFLTGTLNARAFAERAELEISKARRYGHPLTVAYIDVDDFKGINDRFGHSHGDQVLRNIATALKANLRESDSLSRVGGDEFIALLPGTGDEHAREVLSKLHSVVSKATREGESPVTFSVGAVVFDDPPTDVDALIRASDSVMYQAKGDGKNQLYILSDAPRVSSPGAT
jgi:diguanylate cyclase (GGDEF)-like protein